MPVRVIVTELYASVVPLRNSVGSWVMASPTVPLSSLMPVITGGSAWVFTTVTMNAADAALVLPLPSVAVALKLVSPPGRLVPL